MCRTPFNPFQLQPLPPAFPALNATGLRRALTAAYPASDFQDCAFTSFKEKQ